MHAALKPLAFRRACKTSQRRVSSSDSAASSETIALDLFSKRLGPSPHTMNVCELSLQSVAVLLASPKKVSKCSRGAESTKGARVEAAVAVTGDVLVCRLSSLQAHITTLGCSEVRLLIATPWHMSRVVLVSTDSSLPTYLSSGCQVVIWRKHAPFLLHFTTQKSCENPDIT